MITLHEAIRNVQDELIISQQERMQKGIPQLFVTDKLTVEFSCVFSEMDSSDAKGGIHALSVLALDASSAKSVSSEKVHKVTLEFKTASSINEGNAGQPQNTGEADNSTIPPLENSGLYPHRDEW